MPPQRLIGYDLARACAIYGMVIVNFKIAMTGIEPSTFSIWNRLAGLLEGRAAALFVVLAGVGISLLSARGRREQDLDRLKRNRYSLLRRALFLFLVGLAYTPIWPADILHFYGIYLLFGAWLLSTSRWSIALLASIIILGYPLLFLVMDYAVDWQWDTLTYHHFWTVKGLSKHLFFNGFHPVLPWVAFLLIGMIFGRLDARDKRLRRVIVAISVPIVVATETLSRALIGFFQAHPGDIPSEDIPFIFGTGPMPPLPMYMVAGSATALIVIVICLEVADWIGEKRLQPLIFTGQLALTIYVAHVLVGMGILESLGMLGNQSTTKAILAATLFFTGSILFSWLWRQRFDRGPLEWIMRKICR